MRNRLLTLVRRAPFLFLLAGLMIAPSGFGQNRPEGDGNADYSLTPEAGPWMIIVTSYTGPESEKFARDLCGELRNRYKLRAYTFNWGAERRREQDEEIRQKKEAQLKWFQDRGTPLDQPLRLKKVRIDEEHAVLVGGFKDMETARKELDRIKKLDKPNSVPVSSIMNYFGGDDKNKKKDSKTEVNPFQQSFVGRNSPSRRASQRICWPNEKRPIRFQGTQRARDVQRVSAASHGRWWSRNSTATRSFNRNLPRKEC